MVALLLLLWLTMALYAWIAGPLIDWGTGLLGSLWLVWLPVLVLLWLVGGRRA